MNKYDYVLNLESHTSQAYIAKEIDDNSDILEFGTANGVLTKYLKEEKKCRVYGVEYDVDDANIASEFTESMYVGDIEKFEWIEKYSDKKFDFIIFADVLEHLYYPKKVLEKVKTFLNENGKIVISIPNVSHNSIIMQLLNDEFNYNKTGLLDNTHIRFFTKLTLEKMISECGYFINKKNAIYKYPEETEFSQCYQDFNTQISDFLKQRKCGEIYQFVYTIQKEVVEVRDVLKKKHQASLYIDSGDGFFETCKQVINYDDQLKFSFDLEEGIDTQSLRFDPCDRPVIAIIKDIKVNNVSVDNYVSNGFEKERIYLLNDDPYIIINNINNNVKKFEIEFHEIDFNVDVKNEFQREEILKLEKKIDIETSKVKDLESLLSQRESDYNRLILKFSEAEKDLSKITLEYNELNSNKQRTTIYFDTGEGFSELNKSEFYVSNGNLNYNFDFSEHGTIKSLRFDPLDDGVIFKISSIKINDETISEYEHNGFEYDEVIYILDSDPWLVFNDINCIVKNLSIEFEFLKSIKDI